MTSVSSDPQVFKSHHYSASLSSNERTIQFYVSHHQEKEDLNKQNTCTSVSEKLKTIQIHKTEGSPEHSQHLGCQWRRELVTTYDCQTAAAWDPSPPMQQPGGVARLTRSARIGSLHKLSCFSHLDPTH